MASLDSPRRLASRRLGSPCCSPFRSRPRRASATSRASGPLPAIAAPATSICTTRCSRAAPRDARACAGTTRALRDPGRPARARASLARLSGRPRGRPGARRLPRLALHGPELGSLRVLRRHAARDRAALRRAGRRGLLRARRGSACTCRARPSRGVPVEYALTHEYGHHVASWRSNNPWDALDWGAKYWASAMRVCSHVDRGPPVPGQPGPALPRGSRRGLRRRLRALALSRGALAVQPIRASRPRRVRGDPPRRAASLDGPALARPSAAGSARGAGAARHFRVRLTARRRRVGVRLAGPARLRAAVELETAGFAAGRDAPRRPGRRHRVVPPRARRARDA